MVRIRLEKEIVFNHLVSDPDSWRAAGASEFDSLNRLKLLSVFSSMKIVIHWAEGGGIYQRWKRGKGPRY